jgi:3-oxoadipate enol-lactonase
MPAVQANGIDIYYEVQGEGEPMVLIPYLAADQACYAFQVAEYAKHYTCYSVDLRGAGLSGKPDGVYTTELFADDIAAFMRAAGLEQAHVFGFSLGAAAGMWLAARHPEKVKTLSLHSGWTASDPFLRAVVESWQIIAQALANVPEMIIQGIFPWCFTPEMYAARPEYVESLAEFVRSRPVSPVDAFIRQSGAVLVHDATAALGSIQAPTLITFGRRDLVTSPGSPRRSARASRILRSWCSRTARTRRSTRTSRDSTSRRWPSCSVIHSGRCRPGARERAPRYLVHPGEPVAPGSR